jgi:hypothetical protein
MARILVQLAPFGHLTAKDVRNHWARHFPALKTVFTLDVSRRHHDYAFDSVGNMIVNRFD